MVIGQYISKINFVKNRFLNAMIYRRVRIENNNWVLIVHLRSLVISSARVLVAYLGLC